MFLLNKMYVLGQKWLSKNFSFTSNCTLFFLASMLLFSGCVQRKNSNLAKKKSKDFYVLKVGGVECALCAKKAVMALESVPSIVHAEYVCNDSEYIDCYARVYGKSKRKNVLIGDVQNAISRTKFKLLYMQGLFRGKAAKDYPVIVVEGVAYSVSADNKFFEKYAGKKTNFFGKLVFDRGKQYFVIK